MRNECYTSQRLPSAFLGYLDHAVCWLYIFTCLLGFVWGPFILSAGPTKNHVPCSHTTACADPSTKRRCIAVRRKRLLGRVDVDRVPYLCAARRPTTCSLSRRGESWRAASAASRLKSCGVSVAKPTLSTDTPTDVPCT